VTVRYLGYEALFAEWAESQGWTVTKRGWPDFICRRNGEVMAVEVKGGADDISPEQGDTLDNLSAAGVPTYVYHHGLGLKRWRGRKTESVAELQHEIGRLHRLIGDIVQAREQMVPGIHRPPSPEWNREDELNVVIAWCRSNHEGHDRPGTRMTLCSWIYFLRRDQRQTWEDIVSMIGEGFPLQIKAMYRKASRAVEKTRAAAAA
jgi:hypothetical protein